jgi:hypothetical protein
VEHHVVTAISRMIISGTLQQHSEVTLVVDGPQKDQLSFAVRRKKDPSAPPRPQQAPSAPRPAAAPPAPHQGVPPGVPPHQAAPHGAAPHHSAHHNAAPHQAAHHGAAPHHNAPNAVHPGAPGVAAHAVPGGVAAR